MAKAPKYLKAPISSFRALSRTLGIAQEELLYIACNTESFIFPNTPSIKPDGSTRQTFRVGQRLKKIQKAINKKLFCNVFFPHYLHGSIRDKDNPRTYISAAKAHLGSCLLISEDVSNFFGSITREVVLKMWLHLFKFPPAIAELLTQLTTFNGMVPQGAPTSSYIANLILWDREASLVTELNNLGLNYTRYVDDIVISSPSSITQEVIDSTVAKVISMLRAKGLKPNRRKHRIMNRSQQMSVHNIVVNSGRLTTSRRKRQRIRLEVFNLKKSAQESSRRGDRYLSEFNSVMGKVRELKKFHPKEAENFMEELNLITPLVE